MPPKMPGSRDRSAMKLEIVSATRYTEAEFWSQSALGRSIGLIAHDPRIVTRFSFENRAGLADVYNESIDAHHDHDVLLFVHDDLWIQDYFLVDELFDAVEQFDLVGLVGGRQRARNQTTWFGIGEVLTFNHGYLSGTIGQGEVPPGAASHWGPAPAECEFLDGVFLAARKSTFRDHDLRFDPTFKFHFYDMDICSQARAKELRLGTWRISTTHQSGGNFNSEGWRNMRDAYLKKWGS